MKTQNRTLEAIVQAIDDLGANRLPLPMATRLHNARKAVVAAYRDSESLRDALVQPYIPEGKSGVDPKDPGHAELVAKLGEHYATEVEVDIGPAIELAKLNGLGDKVTVKHSTITILEEIGLLEAEAPLAR